MGKKAEPRIDPISVELRKTVRAALQKRIPLLEGMKASSGLTNYRKLCSGRELTARQSIIAKCAECLGWYADGREDCIGYGCPLYKWFPYRPDKKQYVRPDRRPGAAEQEVSR